MVAMLQNVGGKGYSRVLSLDPLIISVLDSIHSNCNKLADER